MLDGIEIAVFLHNGAVTKFAFSPDGNCIVAAGVDANVILMWIVSPEVLMEDVRPPSVTESAITAAAISARRRRRAVGFKTPLLVQRMRRSAIEHAVPHDRGQTRDSSDTETIPPGVMR